MALHWAQKIFRKFSIQIFLYGIAAILGLVMGSFLGLVATGYVALGMTYALLFILLSPILVPMGLVVGAMTLVTSAALKIVLWLRNATSGWSHHESK